MRSGGLNTKNARDRKERKTQVDAFAVRWNMSDQNKSLSFTLDRPIGFALTNRSIRARLRLRRAVGFEMSPGNVADVMDIVIAVDPCRQIAAAGPFVRKVDAVDLDQLHVPRVDIIDRASRDPAEFTRAVVREGQCDRRRIAASRTTAAAPA